MPRPTVATGSSSRASRRGRALHVLVAVAAWAAFDALALWQFTHYAPDDIALDLEALLACAVAFLGGGVAWVEWNRSIYRRRHRRVSPIVREVDFARDVLGRAVAADEGVRDAPGEVEVLLDPVTGMKVYRRVTAPASVPAAATGPEPAGAQAGLVHVA